MTFNRPVLCPDCGEDLNMGDLQVFTFPGQCAKCQSVSKMAESRTQDDLVHLFSNNLTFFHPQPQPLQQQPPTEPLPPPRNNSLGYSPSRPYHHSAHQALPAPSFQPQHPPDPLSLARSQLAAHGIPPSTLSPPHLALFSQAPDDQKLRLIQLWQLASQNNASYDTFGAGEPASPHFAARTHEDAHMEDSAPTPAPATLSSDVGALPSHGDEEPYMASGYEMLAAREYARGEPAAVQERVTYSPLGSAVGRPTVAPDEGARELGAGQGTRGMVSEGWWRHDPGFDHGQPMEHQYGFYQQMGCWGVEARR